MQCDRCGQRPATIYQTFILNGNKQESHLCEECARESGVLGMMNQPNFSNLSIQQLLSSFLGQMGLGGPSPAMPKYGEPRCSHCGMTYSQFANTGVLGCAHCYEDLEEHLTPLVRRVQGTTTHTGKAPKRTGGIARKRRDLAGMRQQLQAAIQNEQYEEAARLRDVIRNMESDLQTGGEGNAMG